ncbi:MAG: ABC transporter ATP-binding protein [Rikenellaceae bacterium]
MKKYLQNLLSLSDRGAKDLMKAILWSVMCDLAILASAALLYFYLEDTLLPTLEGSTPILRYTLYGVFALALMVIMFIFYRIAYDAHYLRSYTESSTKRLSLAEHLRELPLSFFGRKDLTDLTTTMMSDVAMMETALSHFVPQLIGSSISTVVVSVGMIIYDWKMGLAVVWVVPVSLSICYFSKRQQDKVNRRSKQDILASADKVQEFVENIRDIKANSREEGHLQILKERYAEQEKSLMAGEIGVGIFVISSQSILKLGIISAVVVGLYLLSVGEISMLTFILYLVATRIYDPLSRTLVNLAATFASLLSIERMGEIEKTPTQSGREEVEIKNFDIEFKDIEFGYDSSKPVISGVSFTAKQGEVTALVGPSGGGKSTAVKLAARFWDTQKGTITLGGEDISTIAPESLLKYYSIVFQDVTLFNNTVMENIRIGRKDATDEEVIEAARAANADGFISEMAEGYNTMIGENGARISGGERQRLSIARALLKDAPVVLLDEATSALDVMSETQLQEAIARLTKNKTVIVVAHRMRTIAGADKIILLKEGKVAQSGTHATLITQKNGDYARMVALQTQSNNWKIK